MEMIFFFHMIFLLLNYWNHTD